MVTVAHIEDKTAYFEDETPEMLAAFKKAQETFKYFWRELSMEYRRIVPALDAAYVKVVFIQEEREGKGVFKKLFAKKQVSKQSPIVEHMWINEVDFDGDAISGTLMNDPHDLTNVKSGDTVKIPLNRVSDWMFVNDGKTYGGFTVQLLRSQMTPEERAEHDQAWGLEFGDYDDILIAYQQKEHPENLEEHPMSRNLKEKLAEAIQENPALLTEQDEAGYTQLHYLAIGGHKTLVEVMLNAGAPTHLKTQSGKTALDFARQMQWESVVLLLEQA
jgi:uncharacterized protein YegJ (DUF2314 family)